MQNFRNILYASTGISDDIEGLKQALSLACRNCGEMEVLVIYPELPKGLEAYKEAFEASLFFRIETAIHDARTALTMSETDVPVKVEVEGGNIPPAIHITQRVLRDSHDLLIKEAESREGGRGFSSTDMTLLRKCPCPVWLARPIVRARNQVRVAVAISPDSHGRVEDELSIGLLQLSRFLADTCSGELDIIACSDYHFEEYLRWNTRVTVPEETILSAVQKTKTRHHASLNRLIKESGIGGIYHIRYLRGHTGKIIPEFVNIRDIDILVMGTVARSGIMGFLIGNTAESIMERLGCSLLALKPRTFVTPVNPY